MGEDVLERTCAKKGVLRAFWGRVDCHHRLLCEKNWACSDNDMYSDSSLCKKG